MALTNEMQTDLELWMMEQRRIFEAIMHDQIAAAVAHELAVRQRRAPWWRLAWLWLRGLVWKYNPGRLLARRRHAARDDDAQWEHISNLLTKVAVRRRGNSKLKPGYMVKGHIPVDPSLTLRPRELTAQEEDELEKAFHEAEDERTKDAAATQAVMQYDQQEKLS